MSNLVVLHAKAAERLVVVLPDVIDGEVEVGAKDAGAEGGTHEPKPKEL